MRLRFLRPVWVVAPLLAAAACRSTGSTVRVGVPLTAPGAPYRAEGGGGGLVAEMKANAERWDATAHARALSDRPILLIGATFKEDQESLVAALDRAGARRVTALAWNTDHSFSDRRVALARTVTGWLRSSCAM